MHPQKYVPVRVVPFYARNLSGTGFLPMPPTPSHGREWRNKFHRIVYSASRARTKIIRKKRRAGVESAEKAVQIFPNWVIQFNLYGLNDVWRPLNLIVDSAIPPYPFNERQVMNKANLYGSWSPDPKMTLTCSIDHLVTWFTTSQK